MNLNDLLLNAFEHMETVLNSLLLSSLVNTEYENLPQYKAGLGTWISRYLLCKGAPLTEAFEEMGIYDKDEIAFIILKQFYCYLKDKQEQKF